MNDSFASVCAVANVDMSTVVAVAASLGVAPALCRIARWTKFPPPTSDGPSYVALGVDVSALAEFVRVDVGGFVAAFEAGAGSVVSVVVADIAGDTTVSIPDVGFRVDRIESGMSTPLARCSATLQYGKKDGLSLIGLKVLPLGPIHIGPVTLEVGGISVGDTGGSLVPELMLENVIVSTPLFPTLRLASPKAKWTSEGLGLCLVASFNPAVELRIADLSVGVMAVTLDIIKGALVKFVVRAKVAVPWLSFEAYLNLEISAGGNVLAVLDLSKSALNGSISGVMEAGVVQASVALTETGASFSLSGTLQPTLFPEAIAWPTLAFDDLRITSDGHFHIPNGWLRPPKPKPVNFFGFQLLIEKFTLGNTPNGDKLFGLSASIQLHEALPAGGSVDGLRVTWRDTPTGPKITSVSFEGIGIALETPSIALSGQVSMVQGKDPVTGLDMMTFEGAVTLDLIPLKQKYTAQARIGRATDPVTFDVTPFFYLYLDVDLGMGIDLFAGLKLYGIQLVAAWNQAPLKKPDQPWYAPTWSPTPGWYNATPRGVTAMSKWGFAKGAMAVGAGLTIGTTDGRTFAGRFLGLVTLPGPAIMIDGRANLMRDIKELSDPTKEPTFGALAVLDTPKSELLFGIDTVYNYEEGGRLVTISGSTEAFWRWGKDGTWHLYVGKDQPLSARIQARLFDLIDGTAYLMIDSDGLRLGAGATLAFDKSFSKVRVYAQIAVDGGVRISLAPPQFQGKVTLIGKAGVKVFGFGLNLSVDAMAQVDAFAPYHVLAHLKVAANLPWPLPDFKASVALEWTAPQVAPGTSAGTSPQTWPPLPRPLASASVVSLRATGAWSLARGAANGALAAPKLADGELLWPNVEDADGFVDEARANKVADFDIAKATALIAGAKLPRVPPDCRLQLGFAVPMSDKAAVGTGIFAGLAVPAEVVIGDPNHPETAPARATYGLDKVTLDVWDVVAGKWAPVAVCASAAAENVPSPDAKQLPPGTIRLGGAWGPYPSLALGNDAVAVEAKGGPKAPDGTLTGRQHLWLLGANPYEFATFSTSGPAALVPEAFAGAVPTGIVVETPPTKLAFQDWPESWAPNGVSVDDLTLQWTGPMDVALPVTDNGGVKGLDLGGEPNGPGIGPFAAALVLDAIANKIGDVLQQIAATQGAQETSVAGGDGGDGGDDDGPNVVHSDGPPPDRPREA